ncbi:uncharacterized protein PpBr36_10433 [Pyricularia pennisetigena]|uniref:uncharacterized protein n=1 Tax=Pyricularia pennisetigena TaxID=1578925 RepID=UPI0011536214|nr:uncharacterized protein PpBr36_10433 [Pyricularia pennisetigena]TLS21171.1 hypothetical protein PpBr36_10433 [Pyricularia pennisetigena]
MKMKTNIIQDLTLRLHAVTLLPHKSHEGQTSGIRRNPEQISCRPSTELEKQYDELFRQVAELKEKLRQMKVALVLEQNNQADKMAGYAAPARAGPDKLRGLPPTFVDVGGLDLFRQDITKFVAALATAGVDVEFHHYSGLPHGVEMMAPGISKAIAMNKNTCRFICRF